MSHSKSRTRALRRVAAAAMIAGTAMSVAPAAQAGPQTLPDRLARSVTAENINRHLIALQRIADTNGGTRAAHTPGYQKSIDYIAGKLRAAGFQVSTPQFTYNRVVVDSAVASAGSVRVVPTQMTDSPNTPVGGVSGPLVVLPTDATPGCQPEDYAGLNARGAVVLVKRGGCPFTQKHNVAADAGAVAALVYNHVDGPGLGGIDPAQARIPISGLTTAEGLALAGASGAPATVDVRTHRELTTSRYLVTQTRTGRADNVVLAGAQLDSLPTNAGINDTGASSAALLELALQLGNSPRTGNAVRFAWWGAEDVDKTAAGAYLRSLTFEQQLDIAMYLNSNSIASRNAGYFVYDGDNSSGTAGPMPYGSDKIEQAFAAYLNGRGLPTEDTNFDRQWDHTQFITAGIPTGGLYAGSFRPKTEAQAAKWGGTAGVSFDKCHQQACDNLGNVDRAVLDRNADALAFVTGTYALSTEDVNGVPPRWRRALDRAAAKSAAAAATIKGEAE
nr:M28 family peptidase [Kibdelosporangium sp. MJ126-NF4]CEL18504.1 Aminopeptidase Y (Arg, Lys, Leu preference) [Kibdelosporangium sp. MJ126-NF4]CTQ97988.1 Aminopeptidase Y (Arg, Lys, Leu preference) (EC 3.4.11.15) [Kibdelosporangium sp. MJ126-NF4]